MPMMFQLPEALVNQVTTTNLIPLRHKKLQLPFDDATIIYTHGAPGTFIHQYVQISDYLYGEHYFEPLINTEIHITVTAPILVLFGMLSGDFTLRYPDGRIFPQSNKRGMHYLKPGAIYVIYLFAGQKYHSVYISPSTVLLTGLAGSYPHLLQLLKADTLFVLPYSKFGKKAHKEIQNLKNWVIPGQASVLYYNSRLSDFVLSYLEEIHRDNRITSVVIIQIEEFIALIQQFPEKPINVIEQAQRMGMTPRALENAFKSKKGITVLLFVQQQRMEKAKLRLLSTNDSISEISFEVGYTDHSYFSRVFKRTTGKTPHEFRKEN
jgi:AraC-like DNA-binding protein